MGKSFCSKLASFSRLVFMDSFKDLHGMISEASYFAFPFKKLERFSFFVFLCETLSLRGPML
jgi:hypothetical protein